MANVTIGRTGEHIKKLFAILIENPDGIKAKDALSTLINRTELTEFEKGDYPSGGMRFEKIVRFATVDCVKAGWMVKDRGTWNITEAGLEAYNAYDSPEELYRDATKLYREWKKNRPDIDQEDEVIEEISATITFEEAEEWAWSEIEDFIGKMHPYEFQRMVARLLKAMGYHVSWISPPGKDGGIDIFAWNDPLGTKPPQIKVQVKREKSAVNVGVLRSFMALLGQNDVGIFVNTGGFTRDAANEARLQQGRQITLIDLERFFELWIEFIGELGQDALDMFPLKPIYFLSPEN